MLHRCHSYKVGVRLGWVPITYTHVSHRWRTTGGILVCFLGGGLGEGGGDGEGDLDFGGGGGRSLGGDASFFFFFASCSAKISKVKIHIESDFIKSER